VSYLDLLKLAAPEAVVVLTALVVLAIGLARKHATQLSGAIAALGLLSAVATVLTLPNEATLFGGMLVVNPLTSLFKIICLVLALFTVAITRATTFSRHHAEFLALLLLATVGLMLLVGSEELLMIFIGLELTGLSLYLMTAFDKTSGHSAEAGLKYFLFGSTASAFTLFGLSFVYGATGTTALAAIGEKVSAGPIQPLLAAGIVMTLVGLAFKVAAAPFHLWAPDAYQAAPIPSAAFIASGSKVASFVVLGKVLLIAFAPAHGSAEWHAIVNGWAPILAALAALSIVVGNLVALAQTNVRRLLAYSAVAHAGYTLLGIIAGRDGFAATLFYTTIYAVTLLGAFGVVVWVRDATGGDDLSHFVGLRARSPVLAACMAVFMLSLAGLPPLAGFFGKFYLFSAALAAGERHGLLWLVVLALFGSLISLYYYLVVLKAIFVDETTAEQSPIVPDALQRMTLTLLATVVFIGGVLPTNLVARIVGALH
jgi:NADH-quinone oxidoreductase subunit N